MKGLGIGENIEGYMEETKEKSRPKFLSELEVGDVYYALGVWEDDNVAIMQKEVTSYQIPIVGKKCSYDIVNGYKYSCPRWTTMDAVPDMILDAKMTLWTLRAILKCCWRQRFNIF